CICIIVHVEYDWLPNGHETLLPGWGRSALTGMHGRDECTSLLHNRCRDKRGSSLPAVLAEVRSLPASASMKRNRKSEVSPPRGIVLLRSGAGRRGTRRVKSGEIVAPTSTPQRGEGRTGASRRFGGTGLRSPFNGSASVRGRLSPPVSGSHRCV